MLTFGFALGVSLLTIIGLGAWLPRGTAFALRLAGGCGLIILVLFTGHFLLGLGLTASAWVTAAIAALGLVRFARVSGPVTGAAALHPIVILPVLIIGVTLWRGDFAYTPRAWDEFASWLPWVREVFLADGYDGAVLWRQLAYTPGMGLGTLYPQMFLPRFDELTLIAAQTAWHVALLALIWEIAAFVLAGTTASPRASRIGAWVLALGLLAIEASWTLVPQNYLVEKPQIYFMTMMLLAGLWGRLEPKQAGGAAIIIGLLAAATYLVKATALGFAPALLLLAAALTMSAGISNGIRLRHAAAMLLPMAAAWLAWSWVTPVIPGGACLADPFAALLRDVDGEEPLTALAGRVFAGFGAYLAAYKLPITVIATFGLAAALADPRLRLVAAAYLAFAITYGAALVATYVFCLTGYEAETLASLPRYVRLPLRILHIIGPLLLLAAICRYLRPSWPRWSAAALSVPALALAGYQVLALDRAMDNIQWRSREGGDIVSVLRMMEQRPALLAVLSEIRDPLPKVMILAQGSDGFENRIAKYLAIGADRNEQRFLFEIIGAHSYGPVGSNQWMRSIEPEALRAEILAADLIWPIAVDPWIRDVLAPLIADGDCGGGLENSFLIVNSGGVECRDQPSRGERNTR